MSPYGRKRTLSGKPLRVLQGYLKKLRDAGLPESDFEVAEAFLTGEPENKTDDQIIEHIQSAWPFMCDVAKRKGAKL